MGVVLAETVGIDAGAILLGLLAIVAVVALVVAGFVCAPRAARGSRLAMAVLVVALVVEAVGCINAVVYVLRGNFDISVLVPFAVVVGQVALFVQARPDRRL